MKFVVVVAALIFRLGEMSFAGAAFAAPASAAAHLGGTSGDVPHIVVTATDGTGTTRCNLGLLRGVDPTVDKFYASEIDMSKEGLAWLDKSGLMWEAAKKDAEEMGIPADDYIKRVKANISAFACSKVMYGREEMTEFLEATFTSRGGFNLFLGGKNLGKSNILQSLARKYNRNDTTNNDNAASSNVLVLYVDGRLCFRCLEDGLANGIAQLAADKIMKKRERINWLGLLKQEIRLGLDHAIDSVMSRLVYDTKKKEEIKQLRDILKQIAVFVANRTVTKAEASQYLVDTFIAMARSQNANPVLIIDEANVVLGVEANIDKPEDLTKNFLISMISYTKNALSLILVSTQYQYPYKLKRGGFNLQNLKWKIFAGEISPKEMWKLLVSGTYQEGSRQGEVMIGMGPNLAELCLAAYGGHFWNVERAIETLAWRKEEVMASSFLPYSVRDDIIKCLDTNPRTRPLLEAMAKDGFAPIRTSCDPAVELLSQENLGGVVANTGACFGISHTKWQGTACHHALVPTSQCTRLEIADALSSYRESKFKLI